jgi:hypothetical protein
MNPSLKLELHREPLGVGNARELVSAYDVVSTAPTTSRPATS